MSRLACGAAAATALPSGTAAPPAFGSLLRIERACDDAERCGGLREGFDRRHAAADRVCFPPSWLTTWLGDRRPVTVNVPRHPAGRALALHFARRKPAPGAR